MSHDGQDTDTGRRHRVPPARRRTCTPQSPTVTVVAGTTAEETYTTFSVRALCRIRAKGFRRASEEPWSLTKVSSAERCLPVPQPHQSPTMTSLVGRNLRVFLARWTWGAYASCVIRNARTLFLDYEDD